MSYRSIILSFFFRMLPRIRGLSCRVFFSSFGLKVRGMNSLFLFLLGGGLVLLAASRVRVTLLCSLRLELLLLSRICERFSWRVSNLVTCNFGTSGWDCWVGFLSYADLFLLRISTMFSRKKIFRGLRFL